MIIMHKCWKKSITWNIIATTITLSVSYAITRSVDISLTIGILERLIKLVAYATHERIWDQGVNRLSEEKIVYDDGEEVEFNIRPITKEQLEELRKRENKMQLIYNDEQ